MKLPWENIGLGSLSFLGGVSSDTSPTSVTGLERLVSRQLPQFKDQIEFLVDGEIQKDDGKFDTYEVTQDPETQKIRVTGSTQSALASGLYHYLQDNGHVSISWTESGLKQLESLPPLCNDKQECRTVKGSAVVPYRYHFNTVTFGYTTPFYTWEDWEHLLDWAALHGVNAPLAWTGYEQILIEVFKEFGFTNEHLEGFFSGQAYLPWNRFGNVRGSWNTTFDFSLAKRQLSLQKKIVNRMVELGMTPILPSFTGFVPREIKQLYPDANVVNSSCWNDFPTANSNVTFLEPLDPLFYKLQKTFLEKQKSLVGDVSHFYTLDQYNENTPFSGDLDYLKNVAAGTMDSLKSVDPEAVWVMQGWLFYYEKEFWLPERIEAYLSGAPKGDLLILDLFSDHAPFWESTHSYHGHNWIWCELHDFGGNMGLEGSMQFLTQNFTEARRKSPSLVGVGLTPEGQEGNQIVYDIMLAQAWSEKALDLHEYTERHIRARYGPSPVPDYIVQFWKDLVDLVYTNDQTTEVYAVAKSMFQLRPALEGIAEVPGIQPSKIHYDMSKLEELYKGFREWILENPGWLEVPHFHHDVVDIARQVIANRFLPEYLEFVSLYARGSSTQILLDQGEKMIAILRQLDEVLYTNENFTLGKWLFSAKKIANGNKESEKINEFQARNQLTYWGPNHQINDYACKQWAGLVGEYYVGRWERFIDFMANRQLTKPKKGIFQQYVNALSDFGSLIGMSSYHVDKDADGDFQEVVDEYEKTWQWETWGSKPEHSWTSRGNLRLLLEDLV